MYRTSKLIYIHYNSSKIALCYQFLAMWVSFLAVMASFGRSFSAEHCKLKPFLVSTYCAKSVRQFKYYTINILAKNDNIYTCTEAFGCSNELLVH